MATYTEPRRGGDLLLHVESLEYCCVSTTLKNPAGAATATNVDVIGLPVKVVSTQWTFVLAADIANATGVVVSGPKIVEELADAGTTTAQYLVLKNEPAIINKSALATSDVRGSAITMADYYTAMSGVGFELRDVPTNTATQTE